MKKNMRTGQIAIAVLAVVGTTVGLLAATGGTPRNAAGRADSTAVELAANYDPAPGSTPSGQRGGVLRNPVWGHQGHLRTLRPGSVPAHRPGSAVTPQGIVGNDPDDPEESGCWDASAYVASAAYFTYGYVANWYSPDCGTNWAETVMTSDPGDPNEFLYANIFDEVTYESYSYTSPYNGTYTDMTHSEFHLACATGEVFAYGIGYFPSDPGACA